MRTITISNQKGGVAKTTTALALAAALADAGRRVLAIDMDPQSNLTMGLGLDPDALVSSIYHVLLGECPIEAAIQRTAIEGLSVLPAELTLAGAEKRLFGEIGFDEILRSRLRPLADAGRFDYAIVDCPPSLGLLTVNAITAANVVLVPVQCEFFSARGLGQLLEIAETVRAKRNPGLVVRILPTLFDRRNRICCNILQQLRSAFAENLYGIAIGVDTRVRESAAAGAPVTTFAPETRAASEYRALASEILAEETASHRLLEVA